MSSDPGGPGGGSRLEISAEKRPGGEDRKTGSLRLGLKLLQDLVLHFKNL